MKFCENFEFQWNDLNLLLPNYQEWNKDQIFKDPSTNPKKDGAMDLTAELKKFMGVKVSMKHQESQMAQQFPTPSNLLGNDPKNHDNVIQKITPDDIPEDIWALLNEIEDPSHDGWGKGGVCKMDVCSVPTITTSKATTHKPVKTEPSQITLGLYDNELHNNESVCTFPAHDTVQDDISIDVLNLSPTDMLTPSVFLPIINDCKNSPIHFPNFDLPLDVNTPDLDVGLLMSNTTDLFTPQALESAPNCKKETEAVIQDQSANNQLETDIEPAQIPMQVTSEPEVVTSPSNFLTLTIGNSNQVLQVGNGARLQLKRRASTAFGGVQENATINPVDNASAPTIIIAVVDANSSFSTNVENHEIEDSIEDVESVSSTKNMRLDENKNEQRKKNNEASRRSRLTRRTREKDMVKLAEKLEQENKKLRSRVEQLARLRDTVKTQLVNILKRR